MKRAVLSRSPVAVLCFVLVALTFATACVDRLPEQDRRITVTNPSFKTSADILWKEYQSNAREADKKYWGKALEVSGTVTTVESSPHPKVIFVQETPLGVEANLLDDSAADVLKAATPNQRVTLKCFCAGLNGNVILRSCVLR